MHLCVEPRLAALFTRVREERKVEAWEAESRLRDAREQVKPECEHAGVPPLVLGKREEVLRKWRFHGHRLAPVGGMGGGGAPPPAPQAAPPATGPPQGRWQGGAPSAAPGWPGSAEPGSSQRVKALHRGTSGLP